MVDLERTEKEYKEKGIAFPEDKASELQRVQRWKHMTTTEQGNYNQSPDDKSVNYPRREITQIRRKLILDENKEYLTTIETLVGRDGIGNEVRLPMSEPQCYDTPKIRKIREYRDGRDQVINTADGFKRIHTLPADEKAFKELYDNPGTNKSTVSLMVQEVGLGRNEVAVKDPVQFVHRDFYDLLERRPSTLSYDNVSTTPTDPGFGSAGAATKIKEIKKAPTTKVSTIEGEVVAE